MTLTVIKLNYRLLSGVTDKPCLWTFQLGQENGLPVEKFGQSFTKHYPFIENFAQFFFMLQLLVVRRNSVQLNYVTSH